MNANDAQCTRTDTNGQDKFDEELEQGKWTKAINYRQ